MIRPKLTAVLLLAGLLSTGCGIGVQDITLPGGADLGDHPYTVHARFTTVLDLVPQAAVKANGVTVGRVGKITLPRGSWTADVTLLVNGRVRLPANAEAHLEQSSLLGEKYVELAAPKGEPPAGRLTDRAIIPVERTSRNPEVEEVLGALSMLLNGGGLTQINTIVKEMNKALGGRESEVRDALTRLSTLSGDLDSHRAQIVAALDGLDRLSSTVASRDPQVAGILTDLTPGLKVLEEQRGQLVTMLGALDRLSKVAVKVTRDSHDDIIADLHGLAPTLRKLADTGDDLPASLQVLLTFPYTDQVTHDIKGDYINVYATITAAKGFCPLQPTVPIDPPDSEPAARARALSLPLPAAGCSRPFDPNSKAAAPSLTGPTLPGPGSPAPQGPAGKSPGPQGILPTLGGN
ncbi:MCE family protein [Actinomadura verrucosospora]|uniref:Virulence factor Mce family protein n=1 Tax=Actinomadura verrucosospora TaxID=46165 RepID=A0A7D4AX94_ACTVE|nr:MCE family protein [Actinomadura verrucosospora]QKG27089.1 virulence factor Mce family protein [Actinomadura verrucosospora]